MTLFNGGPFDGQDLPIDATQAKMVRLPPPEDLDVFLGERQEDPGATAKLDWPFLYERDESVDPPQYRFVEQ